jgi:hypothetical protein
LKGNDQAKGTLAEPMASLDNLLAIGYSYLNNEQKFIKTPNFYANAMMPAAGMYSTATDMANSSAHSSAEKTAYFQKNPLG